MQGPPPSRSRSTPPAGTGKHQHPWVPQPGRWWWGGTHGNSSVHSPRVGCWCCRRCPTPRQDATPQPHRGRNSYKLPQSHGRGRQGGSERPVRRWGRSCHGGHRPGEPPPSPSRAVGPAKPVPVPVLSEGPSPGVRAAGGGGYRPRGGLRSPLRALSSGSFPAMGSDPRPGRSRGGGSGREPRTGNRERAPPRERSGPAGGCETSRLPPTCRCVRGGHGRGHLYRCNTDIGAYIPKTNIHIHKMNIVE